MAVAVLVEETQKGVRLILGDICSALVESNIELLSIDLLVSVV